MFRMTSAIATVLALLAPTAVAADELLSNLAGEWAGQGKYYGGAGAKPETIFCRITGTLSPGGNTLIHSGRCALNKNSAGLELEITALGAGSYSGSGSGKGIAAIGQATFTGRGTSDTLALDAQLTNTQTKKTAPASAKFAVSPDVGFQVQVRRTDPDTGVVYTAGEVLFAAQ